MSRIFGSVAQNGYVVRDIEKSMERWLELGVGPWFYFGKVEMDWFRHRGEPSDMEMSVAIANSGDLQLELIQQRNEAPSMHRDFLDAGYEGMPPMSYCTDDYQGLDKVALSFALGESSTTRSEERRVGKECRSRRSPYH